MDPILDLMRGRRSVRQFRPADIGDEQLQPLLEAMRWAPSAGNIQPWRAYVVRSAQLRRELAAASRNQRFIAEAPVVVVVAVDHHEAERAYGNRGVKLYCLQDAAAATQNLLLAAHAAGLATCWVGAFEEQQVAGLLRLTARHRPVAIVALGVAAEQPRAPRRRPLVELVRTHR